MYLVKAAWWLKAIYPSYIWHIAEAEKVSDTSKIKYYKNLIVDKTNELESARDKLSNYQKIASGQTVSTEYDSKVVEQENILANLNAQINEKLQRKLS